jgi:hypothetical protein
MVALINATTLAGAVASLISLWMLLKRPNSK